MYKNYLYLFRLIIELNNKLKNKKIIDCFTQEKDQLFLLIDDDVNKNLCLIINTNEFYIHQKLDFKKAKKNVVSFFNDFIPTTIKNIQIAFSERFIRFQCDSGDLIISFSGKNSNCYFYNVENIQSFKKSDEVELKNISSKIHHVDFINEYDFLINKLNSIPADEIIKLPFLTKQIKARIQQNQFEQIGNLLNDFIYGKIAVGIDYTDNKLLFTPLSLIPEKNKVEVELFDTYLDAIEKYFQIEFKVDSYNLIKKEIEKFISVELERLSSKLNNLKVRIEMGSKENEYRHIGDLLLNNINLLNKGLKEISLYDWIKNGEIKIKLDPKLTPQQNVNYYFEKSRSEKIDFEKSNHLFNEAKTKYESLLNIKKEIENEIPLESLKEIKTQLKISRSKNMIEEKKEKLPFRHFIIQDKYNFYVGRDSKSNDQLTTKFAKQNDFWFHARSVAGSHGVLRVENTKEAIPKNILEKAASITAFYSKAKTSKLASVTYTLKKYVVKNSRHEPGQVSVLKENVLLVKPGIPDDCVYVED